MSEKFIERIDAVFLPVNDLKKSLQWYQETFNFEIVWRNERMVGLLIGPNVGFHLVEVPDWKPDNRYTPINFAVTNADDVREILINQGVKVSEWRQGQPKRFDFWDLSGNAISLIEL